MSKREIYRILDAAANRGREALRVVEDAVRFLGDDRDLSAALKETRHRFAAACDKLDRRERLLARDAVGDVGTSIETEDEYRRATLLDVLTANFARLQESARSLEEFSKLVAPEVSREFERVRYDAYSLEKLVYEAAAGLESGETPGAVPDPTERVAPTPRAASPRESRKSRLARTALGAIVDRDLSAERTAELFQAEIGAFQLPVDPRDERGSAARIGAFLERCLATFSGVEESSRPLLLSRGFGVWDDYFDGGVVVDGNWVDYRRRLGDDYLLGAVVSNIEEANATIAAIAAGVLDFAEVGPVFSGERPTGPAFLRTFAEATAGSFPVYAFGGITLENCGIVFDSGIERIEIETSVLEDSNVARWIGAF